MYIVVVSSCLKSFRRDNRYFAKFHFNGAFDGEKINEILANCPARLCPLVGREYIVHLNVEKVCSGILHGRIERLRDLDEVLENI